MAAVSLAVQGHGMSSEGAPEAIFTVGVVLGFASAGTLLGAVGAAIVPGRRYWVGLLLGAAVGLAGALGVALVGGWLAQATFGCLVMVALASLACVVFGAVSGGVVTRRHVRDQLLADRGAAADRPRA